jgi:hypothetical protein
LGAGNYSFYSTETVQSKYFTNVIDLGFSYIYECESTNANRVRPLFKNLDGESIRLNAEESIDAILKKLDAIVVSQSTIGDLKNIYGYTARNAQYITEKHRKINLQIAVNNNAVTIGFPVILGSY